MSALSGKEAPPPRVLQLVVLITTLIVKMQPMKKLLLQGACYLGIISLHAVHGQDCSNYLFLQKDKTVEMTIYDKKGEPNGRQVYQVSDVTTGGGATTGTLNSEMFDKKGKSMARAVSSIRCQGGVMMVDMKMMMPQQQAQQFAKADAQASNIYLEYPATMNPGDALKDGNFSMDINTGGLKETMTMLITDRKVEGKESVTTPAGTWDCYKISYKGKMTIRMGPLPINTNLEGTEWFAPGFGVVKIQSKYGGTAITSIK